MAAWKRVRAFTAYPNERHSLSRQIAYIIEHQQNDGDAVEIHYGRGSGDTSDSALILIGTLAPITFVSEDEEM